MTSEIESLKGCQRTVARKDWTGHNKRKCGRVVFLCQDDGLPLCEKHYNKWVKKEGKRMNDSIESLSPCWRHQKSGAKKGCKDCFEINRRKSPEELERDMAEEDGSYMGAYDGWND